MFALLAGALNGAASAMPGSQTVMAGLCAGGGTPLQIPMRQDRRQDPGCLNGCHMVGDRKKSGLKSE